MDPDSISDLRLYYFPPQFSEIGFQKDFLVRCGGEERILVENGTWKVNLFPGRQYSCDFSMMDKSTWTTHFRTRGSLNPDQIQLVPGDTHIAVALADEESIVLDPGLNVSLVVTNYDGSFNRTIPASVALMEGIAGLTPARVYKVRLVVSQREGSCSFQGCQEDEGPWQEVITRFDVKSALAPIVVAVCLLAGLVGGGLVVVLVRQQRRINRLERGFVSETKNRIQEARILKMLPPNNLSMAALDDLV